MARASVSEVVIDFFGLAAFKAVDPQKTRVLLMRGGKPDHLPCLAVPVADLQRQEDFRGEALPRAVDGSGADLRLFSLRDYELTLQAGEGSGHHLGRLVSLREMFLLGAGASAGAGYQVKDRCNEILCEVTLSGGRIETRADPPFGAQPVRYTTDHRDANAALPPTAFIDTLVRWHGRIPSVLHLESRKQKGKPWKLHLKPATGKEAIRLSIYCLPSSIEPVDSDLGHFLTLYDLLVKKPEKLYYPTLTPDVGPRYEDFPKCIPPALI